jgi:hypothetical protein
MIDFDQIPAFVRDMGVLVTLMLFVMAVIRVSNFAIRVNGTYVLILGRNGELREIAQVTDGPLDSDTENTVT